jgi:hypothetical protein
MKVIYILYSSYMNSEIKIDRHKNNNNYRYKKKLKSCIIIKIN